MVMDSSTIKRCIQAAIYVLVIVLVAFSLISLEGVLTQPEDSNPGYLLGGQTTIFDITPNAFSQPIPGLEREPNLLFFVGNSFFNQNWVTAPASTTARDGLGPLFNSRSCSGCHFKDGRGRQPEFHGEAPTGFVIRLSTPERDPTGAYLPDPVYGSQFQTQSIQGVPSEGELQITYREFTGSFADGRPYTLRQPIYTLTDLSYGALQPDVVLSPRVANQMIGLGLLEAIQETTLLSLADPEDRNSDGISGRPNLVWDALNNASALGRFGWKANQPSIYQQVASAFMGDIGISTTLFSEQNCTPTQLACLEAQDGGAPEIDEDDLLKVVLYSSVLAVPAQRDYDSPLVQRGETIFYDAQCHLCHIPTLQTGTHPTIPALSDQTIHPYTDLLLHDMGDGLSDGRPDYEASGSEWRTPPLWGIGLFESVNGHTYYLHDGRARNLLEAVLWHDGEAHNSREFVLSMDESSVEALIVFLRSL